jgi:hypothetical protein
LGDSRWYEYGDRRVILGGDTDCQSAKMALGHEDDTRGQEVAGASESTHHNILHGGKEEEEEGKNGVHEIGSARMRVAGMNVVLPEEEDGEKNGGVPADDHIEALRSALEQ